MLWNRVPILICIVHDQLVRAHLHKQLKDDHVFSTRDSSQLRLLALRVEPNGDPIVAKIGSVNRSADPNTQTKPDSEQNVEQIGSLDLRSVMNLRLRGDRGGGVNARNSTGGYKYVLIASLHRALKKVLARPGIAWYEDWKLWVGCTLWIAYWLKHKILSVWIMETKCAQFTLRSLQCFGINIFVLHLLAYCRTPEMGLEITCVVLVMQALLTAGEELWASNVAITLFLENIDYDELMVDKKRLEQFFRKVKEFIEEETKAEVKAHEVMKGTHANSVVLKIVINSSTSVDQLLERKETLVAHVHAVDGMELATNKNLIEISDISMEDAHMDCVSNRLFECDTMYMDMTVPVPQIIVLFIAQTGVWWFYFASILWNIDVDKINYTFWLASFIVMQVTMIFNRGDDSVLGNQFPILQWFALFSKRQHSLTLMLKDGDGTAPIPVLLSSLLYRGSLGFFCNTILREIMAFTIPLMLSMFSEPMDFVVYCVGVNFICTVDDMKEDKKFEVHLGDEEVGSRLKHSMSSPPLSSSRSPGSPPNSATTSHFLKESQTLGSLPE